MTRSLFAAVVVLASSVALLARSVFAEAPLPTEARPVGPILAALRKKPGSTVELSTLRFFVEVAGGESLEVPLGSDPSTSWGALAGAESLLGGTLCRAAAPAQVKAAGALLAEYGPALPVTLRAWTLGQQGKPAQAADLLAGVIDQSLPADSRCPAEHPTNSWERAGRLSTLLQCLELLAPTRNVSKQKRVLERAEKCARENHAVG